VKTDPSLAKELMDTSMIWAMACGAPAILCVLHPGSRRHPPPARPHDRSGRWHLGLTASARSPSAVPPCAHARPQKLLVEKLFVEHRTGEGLRQVSVASQAVAAIWRRRWRVCGRGHPADLHKTEPDRARNGRREPSCRDAATDCVRARLSRHQPHHFQTTLLSAIFAALPRGWPLRSSPIRRASNCSLINGMRKLGPCAA
jgi:hypothetical protein